MGKVTDLMTPQELAANGGFAEQPDTTASDSKVAPQLDPAALYGLSGDFVRAVEPHTEAAPVALLVQTLAAYGSVVGRNSYYQVEADRHYPVLFLNLVGASSKARKGVSSGHALKPFETIDEAWHSTRVSSGLSSGEGLIWAVRDPIHKKEAIKEKGGRVSGYQTVLVDEGEEDKRLFVQEPEFASTLRVLGRDGNTLSAVLRNAWDGKALRVITKNSPAISTGAHISLVGHITEDELRRYLDSTEAGNGFGNRILWVYVQRSKCLPEGGEIERVDFNPLVRRFQAAVEFARQGGRIHWDEAAREKWHAVYPELSEGHSGLYGAVTSRAEAQVVRLSLIYALLDCSPVIRQEHLLAALALWEYCEASAKHIFGDALGDPVADEIYEALSRNPAGMTRTEISALFNRHKNASQIGTALSLLQREGRIRVETLKTDGRDAEIWMATKFAGGAQ